VHDCRICIEMKYKQPIGFVIVIVVKNAAEVLNNNPRQWSVLHPVMAAADTDDNSVRYHNNIFVVIKTLYDIFLSASILNFS